MKLTSILAVLAVLAIGFGSGLYYGKKKYSPDDNSIVIKRHDAIYYEGTSTDNAHTMSARFRNAAGLCPGNSNAGLFEFSERTAQDLVVAIDSIKRQVGRITSTSPAFYRGIFGIDAAGRSRLIVSGLNTANREYGDYTKIIEGHLPCPWLCDINHSDIIMGSDDIGDPCH